MSDAINGESKKFRPLAFKPKWSIRVCHTPNKGRDYYTVSYYDEFGKRQRKLFSDQSKAEAEAEKLQRKMNHGIAPGILLNGRDRLIYERAIGAVRPTGIDLDTLTQDAVQAMRILGEGSLAEAARFYVENHINVVQKQVSEVVLELVNDREKNGRSPPEGREWFRGFRWSP